MNTYCVKWWKKTENLNSKIFKTKNDKLIMESACAECKIKKSRFVKKQKAKGLLSNVRIKAPLSKIPLLKCFVLRSIKNERNCKQIFTGR